MLKQKLKQQQLQKLSPQQIQLMKLLQVPTARMEQRIKEELEANPMLEEGGSSQETAETDREVDQEEEYSMELDEYVDEYIEDDPISYNKYNSSQSKEEESYRPIPEFRSTFHDHLEEQWGLLEVEDERKNIIARQIIGSIDADGYLRRDAMSISDDLLFSQNIEVHEEEILEVLFKIQTFDPIGIAARDLQETLLLQIRKRIEQDINGNGTLTRKKNAEIILDKHFKAFSRKHYSKLMKQLDFDEETLRKAIGEILKLNPKPASGYDGPRSSTAQYITPDFILENNSENLEIRLNSKNAPDLHISPYYNEMMKAFKRKRSQSKVSKKDREALVFIKNKIDSARWFIDAIRQRQHTLYQTMYAILQYQKEYFLSGDERDLKPMILKDIAQITNLDISTISRVVSSKYVQTEYGIKRLKEFFSEGIENADGEEVSTKEVKKNLQHIIEKEDKKKPLSDEKLKAALSKKGYNIARRTIAKYREQLGIPVARLRKEMV